MDSWKATAQTVTSGYVAEVVASGSGYYCHHLWLFTEGILETGKMLSSPTCLPGTQVTLAQGWALPYYCFLNFMEAHLIDTVYLL